MRLGIFAKTFPGTDPDAVLRQVARHGLREVQFNTACAGLPSLPDAVPDAALERIRAASERHGVRLSALSGTFNMIHPDEEVREAGVRRLGVLARACDALEIPVLTLCTGTRDPVDMWRAHPENRSPEAYRDLLTTMRAALDETALTGVTLAFEPEGGNVVTSADEAVRLLDDLASDRLGVVFDPANLLQHGAFSQQRKVLGRALEPLFPRIVLAHAKDVTTDGRVVPLGRGAVDFATYVELLVRSGFGGPLILHGMAADGVAESLIHLHKLLATPPRDS